MKKIIAVIPVWGRTPLLKYTIQRLLEKNGCSEVICVGSKPEDKECAIAAGAEWVEFPNDYLGAKWNAGFQAAKPYKPDGILFVGSSDWLSDNWLTMAALLDNYDLVGKADFYLLDIGENKRMCHWPGYVGERSGEPIGIGRLVSAKLLDKIDWAPFDPMANHSMDFQMYNKAKALGKIAVVEIDEYKSLSISTNRWINKHKFEDHWNGKLLSSKITDIDKFLEDFPEAHQIFE